MENPKTLAIIPARGGSKGIPKKNIKNIAGRPLIAWTIDAAKKSKKINYTVVSTDDIEIKEVAEQYGGNVPFLRPPELAKDDSPTIEAVIHIIEHFRNNTSLHFDYIMLLEPTSPVRICGQLDQIIDLAYENHESDGVITLGNFHQSPFLARTVEEGYLKSFFDETLNSKRRQELPDLFFPYGVAYLVKVDAILQKKTFYTQKIIPFFIEKKQCVEIDDYFDFKLAENILMGLD